MSGHTANQETGPCGKKRYDKKSALTALNAALHRRHNRPEGLRAYPCGVCGGWHLTRSNPVKASDPFAAIGPVLAFGGDPNAPLPDEIMWMPGGVHRITAHRGGKAVTLSVDVKPASAVVVQRSFEALKASSPHRPYFDLNHDDKAASAWPVSFAWREQPAPGIYARVEWSDVGRAAVVGRSYRAFSPSFFPTKDSPASVAGVPLNMGGLVNDPAFKAILPVWAKQARSTNADTPMNKLTKLLALLAALSGLQQERATLASDKSKDQADAIKAKDAEISTKLAEAETLQAEVDAEIRATEGDDKTQAVIQAKDAELQLLKAKNARLENERATQRRKEAEALVTAAVKRGAIPAKDEAVQAKWKARLEANPEDAELLAAIPGNPALAAVVTASAGDGASRVEVTQEDEVKALESYAKEPVAAKAAEMWRKDLRGRVEKGSDFVESLGRIHARLAQGGYPVQAANSLGTLSGVLVVQRSLDYLKLSFPILSRISTDFSPEGAKFGQTIQTRLRGSLTLQTFVPANGYQDQDASTTDVPVVIDQHKYVQIAFGVNELASTMRGLFSEQEEPMHYTLGKGLCDALYALFTAGNYANATTQALVGFGRSTVVDIGSALRGRGVVGPNQTLLLNSSYFGGLSKDSVLVNLATYQAAQTALITANTLPDISGLKPIEAINLPGTGNLTGMALRPDAVAMATRTPNDYTTALPGVPSTGIVRTVTNPDTGISVLLTQYVDHNFGAARGRIAIMYGTAKGNGASGQRLISA